MVCPPPQGAAEECSRRVQQHRPETETFFIISQGLQTDKELLVSITFFFFFFFFFVFLHFGVCKKNTLVLFEAHLTLVTSVQLHHTFWGYNGSLVAMSGEALQRIGNMFFVYKTKGKGCVSHFDLAILQTKKVS
jgi:hypothetical protein